MIARKKARRRPLRTSVIALVTVVALQAGPADASSYWTAGEVPIRLAKLGKIVGGGNAVDVRVRVACPIGWEAIEGNVHLVQDEHVGEGSFRPLVCDGTPHTWTVNVFVPEGQFHPGDAAATAWVVLIDFEGGTKRGRDDRIITLTM